MLSNEQPPVYPGLPSYSRGSQEPVALKQSARVKRRPRADLVTQSKAGAILLRLQEVEEYENAPVYCAGDFVRGSVELLKADNVASLELKVGGSVLNNSRIKSDAVLFQD